MEAGIGLRNSDIDLSKKDYEEVKFRAWPLGHVFFCCKKDKFDISLFTKIIT